MALTAASGAYVLGGATASREWRVEPRAASPESRVASRDSRFASR
jgi:hypothetical protein